MVTVTVLLEGELASPFASAWLWSGFWFCVGRSAPGIPRLPLSCLPRGFPPLGASCAVPRPRPGKVLGFLPALPFCLRGCVPASVPPATGPAPPAASAASRLASFSCFLALFFCFFLSAASSLLLALSSGSFHLDPFT